MLSDELNSVGEAERILREARNYKPQTLPEIQRGEPPELKTSILTVMYNIITGRK